MLAEVKFTIPSLKVFAQKIGKLVGSVCKYWLNMEIDFEFGLGWLALTFPKF